MIIWQPELYGFRFWSYDSVNISNSLLLVIYYMYKNKFGMIEEKYRHKRKKLLGFAMKK